MCGDIKSIPRGVLHRFSLVLFKQHTYKKKRKGKNTPQWETQAIDLSKPMYYNFKLVIIIDNSHVPMLLCLLSLSLSPSLVDFSYHYFFLHFFFRPFLFYLSPPFIASILVLITTIVLLSARALGIFSSTLSDSSPPLSWNSDFKGLLVLFRLSHLYLMR